MNRKEKFFCRTCKGYRNHESLHKTERRGSDDDFFHWLEEFHIIECMGCETISFLRIYGDSEMIDHNPDGEPYFTFSKEIFPKYLESGIDLSHSYQLPQPISIIYRETISAMKSDSRILAAGGLRAIIEATCNHLKIKKGNLEQRIDLLHHEGHLSHAEAKRLHSIRFLGNDALHEIERPKKEPLHILLGIVNHLLSNLFINDKLIEGKVEKVVDSYSDFVLLLKSKIKKEDIGKEVSLDEILGKSIRLVSKKELKPLSAKFESEVKECKQEFVSIKRGKAPVLFKIEKVPNILPF